MTQKPATSTDSRLAWLLCTAIVALTAVTFAPVFRNGFVNWDDGVNIVRNGAITGLGRDHLEWMFTTRLGGHYQPLSWLSLALDNAIWGGVSATGIHFTNLMLHAGTAGLFFWVALRLLRSGVRAAAGERTPMLVWAAAFAAAVFAIHPLRVESVAWATERRDVLSGILLMTCVLLYLRAVARRSALNGVGAFVCCGLSLLAKASGMTLPLVLLVVDIYPLRRRQQGAGWGRLLAEKIPFAVAGAAAAIVAGRAQHAADTLRGLADLGVVERLLVAGYAAVFYPLKTLAPRGQSPLYPMRSSDALHGPMFIAAAVGLVALIVAAFALRKRWPALAAALAAYLLILAPVSGLAQSGRHLVADRYSYLSMLPLIVLVAAALGRVLRSGGESDAGGRTRKTFAAVAAVYVAALAPLTAWQVTRWHDSVTLWTSALKHDSGNALAMTNLADALLKEGKPAEAAKWFEQAADLDADDPVAWNGLAVASLQAGAPQNAIPALQRAILLDDDNPEYYANLGYALAGYRRFVEAADAYRRALTLAPGMVSSRLKLAAILSEMGRWAEAAEVLSEAVTGANTDLAVVAEYAWLLATCPDAVVRDGAHAVEFARRVVENRPDDPQARDTLAAALAEAGRYDAAVEQAELAIAGAMRQGRGKLAQGVEMRLQLYRRGAPYHQRVRGGVTPAPVAANGGKNGGVQD